MVTKQQQLEWLVKNHESWQYSVPVMIMSDKSIGDYYGSPIPGCHFVSFTEWQQERDRIAEMNAMTMQMCNIKPLGRDKMSSKPVVDNSWHERGEFPPAGCECEFCNSDDEWTDWHHAVFVGFDSTGNGVVSVFGDDKGMLWISNNSADFRPLHTEREKAIEEMANLIAKSVFGSAKCQAEKLYDAGYRKVSA